MNKKGFIDFDDINWIAASLAILGSWGVIFYLSTQNAGFFQRGITGLLTLVIGYIVATIILES